MPITIQRGAAVFACTVDIMGHRTVIDLAKMNNHERADLMIALMQWKANDYRGYPVIQQ